MELNYTCLEILKVLYAKKDYMPVTDLANHLGKTERSIRYSLDIIDRFLVQNNLPYLAREFGRGIALENTPDVTRVLQQYLTIETPFQYKFSTAERERFLSICLLIGHKKYIPVAELARQLVVSYGTIALDLNAVEKKINENHLTLERKSRMGIRVHGDEFSIRRLCLKWLNESISLSEYESYLCNKPLESKISLLIFNELFRELDVAFFRELPKQAESLLSRVFSDESFGKLIFALAILAQRRRSGVSGEVISPKAESSLLQSEEYSAATAMLDQLAEQSGVIYDEGDCMYLTTQLLSSKSILRGHSKLGRDMTRSQKLTHVADQIVEKMEKLYRIDFGVERPDLVDRLVTHLTPTVYRIRFHKKIVNPIYDELAAKHAHLLRNTTIAAEPLAEYCGTEISAQEISYIALYFLAAISQQDSSTKRHPKVVVACGTGYGTAQVVASQLKRMFDVEIVAVISGREVSKIAENQSIDYDYIVSTVTLPRLEDNQYIKVNPIFNDSDYKKILRFVDARRLQDISGDVLKMTDSLVNVAQKYGVNTSVEQLRYEFLAVLIRGSTMPDTLEAKPCKQPSLMDVLEPRLIRLDVPCEDWESVIEASTLSLEEYGYVTRNYKTAIRQNILEFGPGMVMFPNTLVAHASPLQGCKRLGFSFMTLKKPVRFNNQNHDPVKIVFTLSVLEGNTYTEAIVQLFQMLAEKKYRDRLEKAKTREQVLQIVREAIKGYR